jgi:hypothetical protein
MLLLLLVIVTATAGVRQLRHGITTAAATAARV